MRYLGIDLHKTNFVVCFLNEDETFRIETFRLSKSGIGRFLLQVEKTDAVALEVTQNSYYFYDQIKAYLGRIVLVDTYRFAVIAKSKKKTDKADACALAKFLKLGWLAEVTVPSERTRQLRELLKARETLVGLRTKLKNMAHAAFTRNGIKVARSAFATEIARERLLKRDDLAATDLIILQTSIRQIAALDKEIEDLEAEIIKRGKTLKGLRRLAAIRRNKSVIGNQSAGGDWRHRVV